MTMSGAGALVAGDVMTLEPITVAVDALIEEAEQLMRDHRVSGLPVTDRTGALVGVVSQTDFLHLANPSVRSMIRHQGSGIRVGEVMSRPPLTIGVGTPLVEAARMMRQEAVHRLVVVNDDQRPIGVLSAMDFVTLYAEG